MRRQGFTLIELSIVLVIIGLLIGGIIAGEAVIRRSAFSSFVKEQAQYQTMFTTFKAKYNALPGDFPDARTYWPNDSVYTGFITTNGSGNGLIAAYAESYASWQHLSASGILPGKYLGLNNAGGDGVTNPNVDAPGTKYGYGVWLPMSYTHNQFGGMSNFVGDIPRNYLVLGANMADTVNWNVLFSCEEAALVDIKYDDGLPFMGKIHTTFPQCTNYNNAAPSTNAAWVPLTNGNNNSTNMMFMLGL